MSTPFHAPALPQTSTSVLQRPRSAIQSDSLSSSSLAESLEELEELEELDAAGTGFLGSALRYLPVTFEAY